MDLGKRHQIGRHHEAGNVVGPAQFQGGADRVIERRYACRSSVPIIGEFSLMVEVVACRLLIIKVLIDAANELTPTDYLTDKALHTLQWHLPAPRIPPRD